MQPSIKVTLIFLIFSSYLWARHGARTQGENTSQTSHCLILSSILWWRPSEREGFYVVNSSNYRTAIADTVRLPSVKLHLNWSRDTEIRCQPTRVVQEILQQNLIKSSLVSVGFCLLIFKANERWGESGARDNIMNATCSKYLTLFIWYFQDLFSFKGFKIVH